ncbi:MAG: type II secretion system protein, partial [Planctomycetota bacterium]
MTRNRRQGFTIVEMLVIIAIIAVLMGLLMPALGGVRRRAHKMQEIHALKQVAVAWTLYANSNNDYALPGYLEPDVQDDWNVRYEFMDRSQITREIAAPWTWRLMPYLNYNHEMIHGHLDEPEFDMTLMSADDILAAAELSREAVAIAEQPRFGYNGYYVGGWWKMVKIEGDLISRYQFWDAKADLDGDGSIGRDERISVVARSPATIRDPSNLIVFGS